MTLEDYNKELQQIESQYEESKNNLYKKYGLSQAKYKVGDIITDVRVNTILQVTKIGVGIGLDRIPYPRYMGTILTKKLEPKKNGESGAIYGNEHTELIKSKE